MRLRGGSSSAVKPGGLFAASVTRWQHDDIMQVIYRDRFSFFLPQACEYLTDFWLFSIYYAFSNAQLKVIDSDIVCVQTCRSRQCILLMPSIPPPSRG